MRLAICFFLLTSFTQIFGFVASPQSLREDCPVITVSCPEEVAQPGNTLTFTADVKGISSNAKLSYSWTVSAGTIIKGQNTSSITVDADGLKAGPVTATVEVEGLPMSCAKKASCTTAVAELIRCWRPFDQYGAINFEDETARLDNFAIQLLEEPVAEGYIIVYDGRNGRAGQALSRANRAKNYLIKKREVAGDRIVIVEGGFREEMTVELWIVPAGAEPPTPAPTLESTDVRGARLQQKR
ncbi:MAG: PKD domain-containing protein [Pyrinomonadaceae bacterium]|nr:PKD domain-containing protein [Pyrinomonadaceae bacterium]